MCFALYGSVWKDEMGLFKEKMDTKNAQEKPIGDLSLILASFWSDF